MLTPTRPTKKGSAVMSPWPLTSGGAAPSKNLTQKQTHVNFESTDDDSMAPSSESNADYDEDTSSDTDSMSLSGSVYRRDRIMVR